MLNYVLRISFRSLIYVVLLNILKVRTLYDSCQVPLLVCPCILLNSTDSK